MTLSPLAAALLALAPAPQADAPNLPTPDYTIANTNVVDVVTGTIKPGRHVVIRGDRIDVFDFPPSTNPPKNPVIDGQALYIIPGLFDSHVHYIDEDTFGPMLLAHGVTFVREMGNDTRTVLDRRERLNAGTLIGPRMIASGAIVDGVPPVWPFSEACATPEEGRAAVRKLRDTGVDFIKVYSRLKPEVYAAIMDEARALGIRAAGHVPDAVDIVAAAQAGQMTSEHLLGVQGMILRAAGKAPSKDAQAEEHRHDAFMNMDGWRAFAAADKAALRADLARTRPMVQVPTLVVMEGVASAAADQEQKEPRLAYVPVGLRSFWSGDQYKNMAKGLEGTLDAMIALVGELHRAGVPLLIGTDLANPYVFAGDAVHREMELFAQAGISPADILRMATVAPATLFGVEHDFGTVESGRVASLVLLSANPLEDIRHTRRIVGVFDEGTYYDRAALDALLKGVRDSVAQATPTPGAPTVKLDLPGTVIHRGRYVMSFARGNQSFPAGVEDFLLTTHGDGLRVMSHTQPQGGWTKPTVTMLHVSPAGRLIQGSYRELTQQPAAATYAMQGAALVATPERGDPARADMPEGTALSGPSVASAFTIALGANLAPGESRELTATGFGFPGWKPDSAKVKIRREPDTTLALGKDPASAPSRPARLYVANLPSAMGEVEQRLWLDAKTPLVLKLEITMAFGKSTSVLDVP